MNDSFTSPDDRVAAKSLERPCYRCRNGHFGDRSGQHTADPDVLAAPVVVLAAPVGMVATPVGANPEVANSIV
ncbi:hypothetical protein [Amycolatopsis sp. SID8362]|uniref:hypothetical protein n=1 Tax=Amycolatopsis sp. SID8362 TaxID=2690346 RepID=UPI0013696877|nr:hypothetical protein [Amycolatopsis sp. SID8362]NBH11114.1 hypothetical protein [Amycolatopsis sp. SID8362]NED47806.1 hypothetical protein [Amycolatopsis sp. SID8362]